MSAFRILRGLAFAAMLTAAATAQAAPAMGADNINGVVKDASGATVGAVKIVLRDLATGANRFSQGDYAVRIKSDGAPEVRQAADAFNNMATNTIQLCWEGINCLATRKRKPMEKIPMGKRLW